jgi:hypothetical protein
MNNISSNINKSDFFLTRVVGSNKQISSLPTSFMLFQNYPNPFNPLTTLNFDVPPMHNNKPPAHPGGKGVLVRFYINKIILTKNFISSWFKI